ncbi:MULTISPECIES: hypothetical protein [unclassified Crossiella]|uniref:hypothetical protein n=1 Tax=unclassified Crossiella TaxID=2620835 RepID=UPI001FFE50DE|nr:MULTISPECIES: hypothetical protein [unclassified Crossiella]MCK2243132.1 hypothetical protein [Crossiella sp. S99.2]MCK2257009.1 hypothetical protein [Crossiella sp. S99.1]
MTENRTAIFYAGDRVLVRLALAEAAGTTCVDTPAAADLVVVDACSLAQEDLHLQVAAIDQALPRVVLSPLGAELAPDGTFPAVQAQAEAAALSGAADTVVLRCALLGQDLARACGHGTVEGTFYSTCEPAGAAWLDAADLAQLIGVLAADPGRRGGRAYEVTGPEILGVPAAIELLAEIADAPRRHVYLPEEAYLHALRRAGIDSPAGERLGHHLAWGSAKARRAVSPVLARALGRAGRPLTAYLPAAWHAYQSELAATRG